MLFCSTRSTSRGLSCTNLLAKGANERPPLRHTHPANNTTQPTINNAGGARALMAHSPLSKGLRRKGLRRRQTYPAYHSYRRQKCAQLAEARACKPTGLVWGGRGWGEWRRGKGG
jgi:hypothetical protein